MLKEKAGETAGKIWSALNETEGLTAKQIKKATKLVGECFLFIFHHRLYKLTQIEYKLLIVNINNLS